MRTSALWLAPSVRANVGIVNFQGFVMYNFREIPGWSRWPPQAQVFPKGLAEAIVHPLTSREQSHAGYQVFRAGLGIL